MFEEDGASEWLDGFNKGKSQSADEITSLKMQLHSRSEMLAQVQSLNANMLKAFEDFTDTEITAITGATKENALLLVAKGFTVSIQDAMKKKAGL